MDNRYISKACMLWGACARHLIVLGEDCEASCFCQKSVLVQVTLIKLSEGLDKVSAIHHTPILQLVCN